MGRAAAGAGWPTASPPPAWDGLRWRLSDVTELPRVRDELRRSIDAQGLAHLRDRLLLVLDEMASNALRHGGGRVEASVRRTGDAFLVAVSDGDTGTPPTPAVDRDPSQGGLGLHLIAELSTAHGWYVEGDAKTVWAVLPRH
ncbi:Histidine kinase-like ATPase domain-containing protein [Geodermatophilus dictyosporus]|uniref:Histidine kinase-like ATPase domain-containing protein n=1 Tax=Geodermatophilus dictyosporus TaxID=1523247 RepID=A0A1I5SFK4_9ACTN|nr:ATP-binding protein [Geodermatophilus dictyosporus]SFP69277.1 Histidine kinase-like ATPase domain-containing protein [Geodermatophilus dictyosporus]